MRITKRHVVIIACCVIGVSGVDGYAQATEQQSPSCGQLSTAAISKIQAVAAHLHHDDGVPVIDKEEFLPGTCYRRLLLKTQNGESMTLILSPDQRFLSPTVWDMQNPGTSQIGVVSGKSAIDGAKAAGSPFLGAEDAKKAIVVFSDFECPYCKQFHEMATAYIKSHPEDVRIYFRNAPLSIHPWAERAAEAGVCIDDVDQNQFWRFADFMFSSQEGIRKDNIDQKIQEYLKTSSPLLVDTVNSCLATDRPKKRVEEDRNAAKQSDLRGTPLVISENGRHSGFHNVQEFESFLVSEGGTK